MLPSYQVVPTQGCTKHRVAGTSGSQGAGLPWSPGTLSFIPLALRILLACHSLFIINPASLFPGLENCRFCMGS